MSLVELFAKNGHPVDGAVAAWIGLNPTWTHGTNLSFVCNRSRALAVTGDRVEVWSTWSGPPSRLVYETSLSSLGFRAHRDPFERVEVGTRSLWVDSRDRAEIQSWLRTAAD